MNDWEASAAETIWLVLRVSADGKETGVLNQAFRDEEDARWFTKGLIDTNVRSSTFSLLTVELR